MNEPSPGYRPLALVLTVGLCFFSGYQGLTVLTPHFVDSLHFRAVVVGMSTTVFVATASVSNLVLGIVARGRDIRRGCVAAALLLGAPCFVLPFQHDAATILVFTALRGIGLGFAGVLLGTAAAVVAPAGRRGLAVGLLGLTGSGIAAFAQAGCLFLSDHFGFATAFTTMGVVTLLGVLPVLALGDLQLGAGRSFVASAGDVFSGDVLLPSLLWFSFGVSYGALLSFGPQRLDETGGGIAVIYFLCLASSAAISRGVVGWLADRFEPWWAFVVALGFAAAGLAILGSEAPRNALVLSAVLYGSSLGVLSTGGLVMLLARVDITKYNMANGLFNFAGLAGIGLGGLVFGLVVDATGARTMFLLSPLVILGVAVVVAVDFTRVRRAGVPAVAAALTDA